MELPDGDFIDLDWTDHNEGPVVILLHGLEGNSHSHYAKGLLKQLHDNGYQAVLMYFRGCNGEINRLPRAYHSGETGDIGFVAQQIKQRFPERNIYGIGISLGGNVLLKWLGESGENNILDKAVAVSVPFDLLNAATQLNQPESRIYQRHLVNKLQSSLHQRLIKMSLPIDKEKATKCKTIWEYDDHVTAPLHGFINATDYYQKSSSRQYLKHIKIPTLIIHSSDDPFMTTTALPEENELSSDIFFELSVHGGHVGFISGNLPFKPEYWLEHRCCQFLNNFCKQSS